MITFLTSRRLLISGLALLVAVSTLRGVVAGQSAGTGVAARVQLLSQNVERAESVRAVKRVQETDAQYSQFGMWTEMAALFSDSATRPDCVPCVQYPETSMKNHGYQLPPS